MWVGDICSVWGLWGCLLTCELHQAAGRLGRTTSLLARW